MLSGVKSSGAVQSMGALVNEKEWKRIVFRPKSPRRACGGWLSLIRMFDCRDLQYRATIGSRSRKTYPTNVPMH